MDEYLTRLVELLDALGCGAVLLRGSGEIVHVNQRMCDYAGRARAELLGRRLTELYHVDDERVVIAELLQAAPREREFFVPRPDGSRVPVMLVGRQLPDQPPFSDHRIITLIDISQHKLANERLQEQYEEISKLSDAAVAQALDLKSYSQTLEERVGQRTAELHEANLQAIYMLAVASEAKDTDTGAHVRRIQLYSQTIARELALSDTESEHIGVSSILHDVGKIHVPDRILQKPGPLSDPERTEMRRHTIAGERIISDKPFFDVARAIARNHHEDFNGGGYPDGLTGLKIPHSARIVHLVDVYDALTSRRVYKPAWTPPRALSCILENRGKQFDPDVVDAFVSLYRRRALLDTADRQPPAVYAPADPRSEPRP